MNISSSSSTTAGNGTEVGFDQKYVRGKHFAILMSFWIRFELYEGVKMIFFLYLYKLTYALQS